MLYRLALGFFYGGTMAIAAFFAAVFGHGCYVLVGLASSPFCLLGIPFAMIAPIVLWPVLFALVERPKLLVVWFAAMVIHYCVALAVLIWPNGDFSDWERLGGSPRSLRLSAVGMAWYFLANLHLWSRYRELVRNTIPAPEPQSGVTP